MRLSPVILLLAISLAFASNDTAAENETGIIRFLGLQVGTSCPGDMLHMDATSSDGIRPAGIELRLVLYEPYYGLRGIAHTDANGTASMQLSKTGYYRIYFTTTKYNHPDYVEFNYSSMCPPPPPKEMDLSISADCGKGIVLMNATSEGNPLDGVFIRSDYWSTMSGQDGSAFLPFLANETDYIFLEASKDGYTDSSGWFATCGNQTD